MFSRWPRYFNHGPPAEIWSVAKNPIQKKKYRSKKRPLTALALDLDQDGQVLGVLAIPLFKRLEELETVARGVNQDLNGETVLGGRLEGILSWVVPTRRELMAGRRRKLERSARGGGERVREGVEGERAGKGEGGDDIGGSDKGVGGGVGVVASGKVAVVRGND